MSIPYYKQYQARHYKGPHSASQGVDKPANRLQSEGLGHSRGVGVNACDGCFYLRKCQARIRLMDFWPHCFACSPLHKWYLKRYGREK